MIKIKQILHPTDFSPCSQRALAEKTQASLTLFHALEVRDLRLTAPYPAGEGWYQPSIDQEVAEVQNRPHHPGAHPTARALIPPICHGTVK